ncbi:MAG: galactokinase family protein [Clostridia bacterium]|nr:galactokinase family protein [Clostridia bacterium]
MNTVELKNKISNGSFDKEFAMLYGDIDIAKARYIEAVDAFCEVYGDRDNVRLFSAPGRTEIGGNHTDHQHGLVLAGSVNLDVIAVVSANDSDVARIKSKGYNIDELNICELDIKEDEKGRSKALIRGVMAAFKQNGHNIGGFDAYTTSNVLKGSGLSSSAAFEVLVATIINGVYNEGSVDHISIAKYSQLAEREYFGKPCGLLDQMASASGGFTYADFNNPTEPVVEKINLDLSQSGHTLCVVDTGGNHANLTGDYADITVECRAVSNALGVEFLRDANQDKFYQSIAEIRAKCGDRAVLRAMHIFDENNRVTTQKNALKRGDFNTFFAAVKRSGESSYDLLQNVYSPSNPKEQAISLGLALTKRFLNGRGAYRVHGGGFAGTIQCYIPNRMFDEYKAIIEKVFGAGSCIKIFVRPVGGYELKGD